MRRCEIAVPLLCVIAHEPIYSLLTMLLRLSSLARRRFVRYVGSAFERPWCLSTSEALLRVLHGALLSGRARARRNPEFVGGEDRMYREQGGNRRGNRLPRDFLIQAGATLWLTIVQRSSRRDGRRLSMNEIDL